MVTGRQRLPEHRILPCVWLLRMLDFRANSMTCAFAYKAWKACLN
jgi:hypothetical protein